MSNRSINMLITGLGLAITVLSGCNGNIYTKRISKGELSKEGRIKGIIHYPQKLFYEVSVTTIRKNEKGEVIGWATDKPTISSYCKPITGIKLVTRPDFNDPINTYYDPAWLEAYKFSATFSPDGTTLTSIGSDSAPDRGQTILNLTSAAANVAKGIVALEFDDSLFPCNEGSVVINIVDYKTGMEAIREGRLESLKKVPMYPLNEAVD